MSRIEKGSTPREYLPPVEGHHSADGHIARVIRYASMDSPREMTSLLFNKLPAGIDQSRVNQAHAQMCKVHKRQPRGNRRVPFIVHPLAVGLLTVDFFGEKITTDHIVISLLHDTVETGKINGRRVTVSDIREEFGEMIAAGVDGFSNVTDQRTGRIKLKSDAYCHKILAAHARYPELELPRMKMFADRILNYFDPVTGATEAELAKRRKKLQDETSPFVRELLKDPTYENDRLMVRRACQIAGARGIDLLEWSGQRLSQGE